MAIVARNFHDGGGNLLAGYWGGAPSLPPEPPERELFYAQPATRLAALSRGMDPQTFARATGSAAQWIGMGLFDFASGTSRVWTGAGTLRWGGADWLGVGDWGTVSGVQETIELRAAGVTVTLSGIPAGLVSSSIRHQDYRGRRAVLYWGLLNEQLRLDREPLQIWSGYMDVMTLTEGNTASIALQCENRLVDLERRRTRRYTDADQQDEFPGDRFFEYVPSLQDAVIQWS